jgi:hypothetical protein
VSLFLDTRAEDIDALNARLDEMEREIAQLKAQGSTGNTDGGSISDEHALGAQLDAALESAFRRIGITIARGGSLEDAAGAVASQLERVAGRRLESWLIEEAGGGLLGALIGGAGAALFGEAIDAVVRAIKPRRQYLPAVEESAYAGFPLYAARGSIFPAGTERDDTLERNLARELARTLSEEC